MRGDRIERRRPGRRHDGGPGDRPRQRDGAARPHRPAHPPHRRSGHELGVGAAHDDTGARGNLRRCERAHDLDGRLHHGARHGPDLAVRGHRLALRDRQGVGARSAAAGRRQLRLRHRRRRRRAAVLHLRRRPHCPQPGGRRGRGPARGAHESQERRGLHQDPGDGRRDVEGHPAGRPAVLGRGTGGGRRGGESLGPFVAAHAHGAEGIKAAIRAGVRTVDHGSMLDEEGARLLKEKGDLLRADAVRRDTPSCTTTRR